MQDRELYRQILGIEASWFVERVELKLAEGEVHVYLEHQEIESWPCPECGGNCPLHDHQEERQWRHLDTCQKMIRTGKGRCQHAIHGAALAQLAELYHSSHVPYVAA